MNPEPVTFTIVLGGPLVGVNVTLGAAFTSVNNDATRTMKTEIVAQSSLRRVGALQKNKVSTNLIVIFNYNFSLLASFRFNSPKICFLDLS